MAKVINKDEIWVTIKLSIDRISHHLKVIKGILLEKIDEKKDLLSRAGALANKISDEATFLDNKKDFEMLLVELKEVQSFILENKIENSRSYSVIADSFENMITAFEAMK